MILIVGAGGHGQVVADIFRARRTSGLASDPTAFLDDNGTRHGALLAGSRVAGSTADIGAIAHDAVVVAIGDNVVRARVFLRLAAAGECFAVAEHPRCILAEDVLIGRGSMLCAGSVINTGSVIGEDTIINTGATIDHHSTVGDHVHVAPGVHMGGEVRVGDGAFIGIGAVVLPHINIGAGSIVGAGAVVTRNVPPGVTVTGVPARTRAALAQV